VGGGPGPPPPPRPRAPPPDTPPPPPPHPPSHQPPPPPAAPAGGVSGAGGGCPRETLGDGDDTARREKSVYGGVWRYPTRGHEIGEETLSQSSIERPVRHP
jgi:hypothetical protein